MVQKITVQSNQNLLSIATGDGRSIEAVLDIMTQTGLSITSMLEPGQSISFDLTGKKYETPPSAYRGVYVAGALSIAVRNNQNLIDIAFQEAGSLEGLIDLMKLNGLSVTQVLNAGQALTFQMDDRYLTDTLAYIKGKNLRPATGRTAVEGVEYLEGIDYWAIQEDFIVS
jgi:hypothetical protein